MTASPSGDSITLLGAGSWGTALAIHMARSGFRVKLWGNEPEHMARLAEERCNQQFLPDIPFPDTLQPEADLKAAMSGAHLVMIAIPSHAYRAFLSANRELFADDLPVSWASKGLEQGTGKLLHQVVQEELPQCRHTAVLSGPTFAREVAANLPTAITVASSTEWLAEELRAYLHTGNFRAYMSHDIIGVELGGALKNVLAIAAGASDGLGFGANARAALITRGLAEIMRLGEAMGAQRETFMGLAGLGDLVLTCTDNQSRNRRMGLLLAEGLSIDEAREKIGQEVEGVRTAQEANRLAEMHQVDMPIVEQVFSVLYHGKSPKDAVKTLLSRDTKVE